jgi:hypothetical protein
MTSEYVSGKRARKLRIRANHERLHREFDEYVTQHGAVLTYEQWLNPQMRRKVALDELSAQAQELEMGYRQ